MAVLSQLLGKRELAWEDNIEKGRIWVYQEGNEYSTKFCNCFCWQAPACGKVIMEVWGASGSGARQCCCAMNVPGNPGAYVKKCICVVPGNYICGCIGFSCGNADARDHRGRSEPTALCWYGCAPHALYTGGVNPNNYHARNTWKGNNPFGWGNGCDGVNVESTVEGSWFYPGTDGSANLCCAAGATAGCVCAQGGRGGYSYCTNNPSPYSCMITTGNFCSHALGRTDMCNTSQSTCGMICNIPVDRCVIWQWDRFAYAYGGDHNCCGTFSCRTFHNCVANCECAQEHHLMVAAGKYATEGAVVTFLGNQDSVMARTSGSELTGATRAIQAAGRWPSYGHPNACYNSFSGCNCYEDMGCLPMLPPGVSGPGGGTCGDVRTHGMRGGHGAVRIKFIPNDGETAY